MRGDELIWQGNPSFKGMLLWYGKAFGIALLIDLLLIAANLLGVLSLALVIFLILISIGVVLGLGHLTRKTTIYTITRVRVMEKRGIINTVKEQAAIDKITNIVVNRSLSERLLGIGRINIDTASDMHSDDILQWWGIEDPYRVEGMIDGLRIEADDQARAKKTDDGS